MRIFIHIGNEKLELEDIYAAQEFIEDSILELEGRDYKVTDIRTTLLKSGKNLDVQKDIYLT